MYIIEIVLNRSSNNKDSALTCLYSLNVLHTVYTVEP